MSEPVTETVEGHDDPSRRDFIYIAAGAAAAGAAAAVAVPLVHQMNPAADTLALASIEFDVSKVAEGEQIVVKFLGKPLFVRHRTQKEIDDANAVDVNTLRDPQTDAERVKEGHEKFLIVSGVCTHLGCIPNMAGSEYGGWFCPCHASDYDTSGRIRKGPAPKNLEVPNYTFVSETKVKVG